MFNSIGIIVMIFIYAAILFGIAIWVRQRRPGSRYLRDNPVVYTLGLAVYMTTWTFYGSVGNAATSGTLFLTIYLGPTLGVICWWFILRKLVRIKSTQRITSIADFISARYGKSQLLASLATLVVVIGTMPYVALQLKAVSSTFGLIANTGSSFGGMIQSHISQITVGLMMVFTIIFGVRRLDPTEHHSGATAVVAIQSVIKMIAFLAVGIYVTFLLYDGFGDIFTRFDRSAYQDLIYQAGSDFSSYTTWISYLILSMSAILFLPRQFHAAVIENTDENHIKTAMWLFPLYMLIINIFVIPIAYVGLLQGIPSTLADNFVILLPRQAGQPALALLVFFGGLSAAMSMILVSTMTTTTMVSNYFVLPLAERIKPLGFLRRYILPSRWVIVVLVLLVGYGAEQLFGTSYTLVNMGLISFAAVLQFAPAIIGGLFWTKGSRAGAIAGILSGFLMWFYTLLLPSFAKSGWLLPESFYQSGPFGIGFLNPEALFGLSGLGNITHAVFWTMLFNIGLYVTISLAFPEEKEENQQISEEFVNALQAGPALSRLRLGQATIQLSEKLPLLKGMLNVYFSDNETEAIIQEAISTSNFADQELVSVSDLASLQSRIERTLAGVIGSASAHQAARQSELFSEAEARELSDVYSNILADLRVSPEELQKRIDYYQERDDLLTQQADELENIVARRTHELEAATQVTQAVASILDPDELIKQVVNLIQDAFDLYYVGLFIVDERGEWARLRMGTGEAGQAMLARDHRIKIGEGMIGWCIANAQTRVALEAGDDAVRLATAELPDTRSEAALPLRSRGRVLGAFTVQDNKPGAFGRETLAVLQNMADQVAIALDNARLYAESQEALETSRRAFGDISREAWNQYLETQADIDYLATPQNVLRVREDQWAQEMSETYSVGQITRHGADTIHIPIILRDQTLGVVRLRKREGTGVWSNDEIELMDTLVDQLETALETARLYSSTQLQAERERITHEVTNKLHRALDMDSLMQTLLQEIFTAMDASSAFVQLSTSATSSESALGKTFSQND